MVKNPPANAGVIRDAGSIPELGRSPGGGMVTIAIASACIGPYMGNGMYEKSTLILGDLPMVLAFG